MHTRHAITETSPGRRGSIAPAIVAALAVAMAAIALALDRAWIDTAQVELSRTTEAAALAAARELVSDDLLRPASHVANRVAMARQAAERVAALNTVVGQPLSLADGDITFGKYVYNQSSDSNVFLETELDPQSVVVAGHYERSRGNPVALVMRGFGGPRTADLARLSIATLDNRLIGVRAGHHLPVPALPLAILDNDPKGNQTDTWNARIVGRTGPDAFGYDETAGRVVSSPDGISEILLSGTPAGAATPGAAANMCLVDFSGQYDAAHVTKMIARGWTKSDLAPFQSEIRLARLPVPVAASFVIGDAEFAALQRLVGECRICPLFRATPAAGTSATTSTATVSAASTSTVSLTGLVAGRIMSLSRDAGGAVRIVFQPAVMVTRAAETVGESLDPAAAAQTTVARNPYIFKMTLSQ